MCGTARQPIDGRPGGLAPAGGAQIVGQLAGLDRRGPRERRLRHGVVLHGEAMRRQPSERGRQRVDGVVRPRHRRVPALVLRRESEGDVGLLGGLHPERHATGARRSTPPASRVERVVGGAPGVAAGRAATGCPPVASVSSSQVSTMMRSRDGHEPLALPAHHVGDQHRRARLVVERPAADEPAVLLAQHVRVVLPILAFRGDDVEVGQQQDGLSRRALARAGWRRRSGRTRWGRAPRRPSGG